jgi:hypothetical protein
LPDEALAKSGLACDPNENDARSDGFREATKGMEKSGSLPGSNTICTEGHEDLKEVIRCAKDKRLTLRDLCVPTRECLAFSRGFVPEEKTHAKARRKTYALIRLCQTEEQNSKLNL